MTKRKRPAAGIELAYENEQYSVVSLNDPRYKGVFLRVYSKPYHDFLFIAWSVGLEFTCKRCKCEHTLRWWQYHQTVQADVPPYDVLCVEATDKPLETWLVRSDEPIPTHLRARKLYTLDSDAIALVDIIIQRASNLLSSDTWLALQEGKSDI